MSCALGKIVKKIPSETYKKYLNVVSNTLDYQAYLKNCGTLQRKSQSRSKSKNSIIGISKPTKNNLIYQPKNNISSRDRIQSESKLLAKSGAKSLNTDSNQVYQQREPSIISEKTETASNSESRYSKQMENRMALRILDASFSR